LRRRRKIDGIINLPAQGDGRIILLRLRPQPATPFSAMMTRRDFKVMLVTLAAAVGAITLAQETSVTPQVMGSSVFDWTQIPVTKTEKGELRKFFQSPTATLDELECHVTTLNPGEMAHPPHQHPDEELIIVKEGTVESLVNGDLKTVGPGSIIFQASNQMHSIKNVGNTPTTYYVIKWNSPGMLKKRPPEIK
jgi:quercetin dioxygenase-like cupin family protein